MGVFDCHFYSFYTHICYIMEWLAPLVLPVRFGVKLNTINSCLELLLCDQIMDLTESICYTATNNNGISLLFAYMKQTKGVVFYTQSYNSYCTYPLAIRVHPPSVVL